MKQSENRWKTMEFEKHYTVKELHNITGIPIATLTRDIRMKNLIAYKKGKSYYIPKSCFDKYIDDLILKKMGINQEILEAFIYAEETKEAVNILKNTGKYKDKDLECFIQGAEKQLKEAVDNFKKNKLKDMD